MSTTLNSVTIASPFEVQVIRKLRGSGSRAANGTYNMDYYSSTLIRDISLKWRALTPTERNDIIQQVQNAITAARTLTLPDGDSISVYFDPNASFNETKIKTSFGTRYNLDIQFTEAV